MSGPPTHTLSNGTNFNSHNHLTLNSGSGFPTQPPGQTLRAQVMGLERLGIPEGVQGSSSNGSTQQSSGKLKGHPHGKKTKGRVKIKMEFIDNKLRRYTTFSKRKAGLMKKAYELSTLTGTEVMLLVASETAHVYTFATRKLQPMIASEDGKKLIQTCLNPYLPNHGDAGGLGDEPVEHRMNLRTGFDEEADEEDEYFDEDGDSSTGSPHPGEAQTPVSGHPTDNQNRYRYADGPGDVYGQSGFSSAGGYDNDVNPAEDAAEGDEQYDVMD